MGTPKKKTVINCVKQNCTCADNHGICYKVPFEAKDVSLKNLFCYFLYRAPGINSAHKGYLEQERSEILLEKINEKVDGKIQFCCPNAQMKKELAKINLADNELCLKCTRAMCKRSGSQKPPLESDLACLLRHIRNSIAHGYVYFRKSNQKFYLLFEDYTPEGKLSAKIVCCKEDLEQWKSILAS